MGKNNQSNSLFKYNIRSIICFYDRRSNWNEFGERI